MRPKFPPVFCVSAPLITCVSGIPTAHENPQSSMLHVSLDLALLSIAGLPSTSPAHSLPAPGCCLPHTAITILVTVTGHIFPLLFPLLLSLYLLTLLSIWLWASGGNKGVLPSSPFRRATMKSTVAKLPPPATLVLGVRGWNQAISVTVASSKGQPA